MRRAPVVAVFLAGLVGPAILHAQHSGGHAAVGGGHVGGFRATGPAPSGGFRSFAPSRAAPRPSIWGPSAGRSSGLRSLSRGSVFGSRNAPSGLRSSGRNHFTYFRPWFRPRLWGYWGYPGYFGTGYPWSSLSYPGFPDDNQQGEGYGPDEAEQEGPPPQYDDTLANQVQELTDEVATLRQQMQQPPAGEASPTAPQEKAIPTVFAYRDGHRLEAQNYAIQGQTLWVFGDQITRKISLADLDLSATKQLNDSRGVEFSLPRSQ